MAPVSAVAARTASFSASTRPRNGRASGMTGAGSGRVKVSTVAPWPTSARCMARTSSATRSASNDGRSTSFMPATTVARSGASSSATGSCSVRIRLVVRPRMARLAYSRPPWARATARANRSAQPR
ncbi:hypothetical protein B0E53_06738 [Micromonospora sp. MH33]|nr:hypothetical protein B0E53_06738 [Micromonospora sp. MH33]